MLWVGSHLLGLVFLQKDKFGHRDRPPQKEDGKKSKLNTGGRDQNDAAIRQGTSGVTRSWRKQRRIFSLQVSEEVWPFSHPDFELPASRTVKPFLLF